MSAMSDDTIHGHGIGVGAAAAGIPVVSSYGTWNTTGVYNGSASSSAEGAASNGFFITGKWLPNSGSILLQTHPC